MKQTISSLSIGQKVWATVEELLEPNELIVNFDGDLLRVANRATRRFRPGQRIQLHVESTQPLNFKLVEPRRLTFGLDVEI